MSETPPNTLQYRVDGREDAPVLVLGPSLGTTFHMWDRQIPELTRDWRVVRFDLPGHGGAPAEPFTSVAELGDRLLATLDEIGVQRFGYAGCSLGGAVGLDLALRAPHRVASLALVATSPRFGTADEFRQRGVIVRANGLEPMARTAPEQWFTPLFAGAQPAIVDWAVQMVRTTDPGCYIAACEALAVFDVREALGSIGIPALVLVGSEDQVTGPAEARTLVAGIADARLAVVPGASHLAPVEQPAAVTDLLTEHFSGIAPEASGTLAVPPPPAPPVPAAEPASAAPDAGPAEPAAPTRTRGGSGCAARSSATPMSTRPSPTTPTGPSRSSSPAMPGARSGAARGSTGACAAPSPSPPSSPVVTGRPSPTTPAPPSATACRRRSSVRSSSTRACTAASRPPRRRWAWSPVPSRRRRRPRRSLGP